MDSYFSYLESEMAKDKFWTYDILTNLRQITPVIQSHLKKVYLTLCCTLIASAVGAYFHIFWNIGGFITAFGSAGSIIWITSILKNPHEEQKGVAALMASGFCYGATFGLGIDLAVPIHPSILVSASVGCAVAFGCFSAAAMLTRRREYLYLGGLLSSSLFLLFWLHFASSVIGGSYALFTFDLYFGLMVFMGYNVIHTQGMIGRAHSGDLNYINDALGLFTGILTFTIGLFIITLKNVQNAW